MRALSPRLPPRPPGRLPSGWPVLDELLGGGWPLGQLLEIRGQGRTSLALGALRSAQQHGLPVAWIDGAGGFCPATAEVDPARLTVVQAHVARRTQRPARLQGATVRRTPAAAALFAADVLLRSRSYALLVLDLPARSAPAATWFRLARLAGRAASGLLLLHGGRQGLAGSAAALLVEVRLQRTPPPAWGEFPPPALEVQLLRQRPATAAASAAWHLLCRPGV